MSKVMLCESEQEILSEYLGKNVLVRSVTMHNVGRLVGYDESFLKLESASWVADSGRWSHALKTGEFDEVEPFVDPVLVGRAGVIDLTEWQHDLPTEAK